MKRAYQNLLMAKAPQWEEPGRTWGCRFTSAGLKRMLRDSGFEILHAYEIELFGNERREDRGSVYALCRPEPVLPG
jgi:hypothetical protein